jgi:hypothetical protein
MVLLKKADKIVRRLNMNKKDKKVSFGRTCQYLLKQDEKSIVKNDELNRLFEIMYKPSTEPYSKTLKNAVKSTAFFVREEMRKSS